MVYVRLADRSTRGAPAWMFDPVVCSGVRLAGTPLIACGALTGLAVLLAQHREISRLEDMNSHNRNQRMRRRVKNDGQLMLGIGSPHQPQHLPEPNHSQCISLLGRMVLCAINHNSEPKNDQP